MDVEILDIKPRGSFLVSVDFYRLTDGTIHPSVTFMPPELIETTGVDVPDRLRIVAGWMLKGAGRMVVHAAEFDTPANDRAPS